MSDLRTLANISGHMARVTAKMSEETGPPGSRDLQEACEFLLRAKSKLAHARSIIEAGKAMVA